MSEPAPRTRKEELREECQAFHEAHTRVWILFDRFTWELIARGCKHGGVGNVWERIRWETIEAQTGESEFKLNNNYRAFYGRRWMKMNPEHGPSAPELNDGFYRKRKQISGEVSATGLAPLGPDDFE